MPALHVTCWETFYVSNLTAQPMRLLPLHAVDPAHALIECGAGSTMPVSISWAAAVTSSGAAAAAAAQAQAATPAADQVAAAPAAQQASAATWPCNVAVQPLDSQSACSGGGGTGTGGGNGSSSVAAAAVDSCPRVSLAEPCRRRWISVTGADGSPRQVAYRLLRGRGRHHLVLYDDQQPPLRVLSGASLHLEVGLSAPQHQGCACCSLLWPVIKIEVSWHHNSILYKCFAVLRHVAAVKALFVILRCRMGRFTYGDDVSQAFLLAPGQQVDCEVAHTATAVDSMQHRQQRQQQQQQHSATGR